MNPWGDFNDAPGLPWEEDATCINHGAIATFLEVVFGYCDGLIPIRGFVDQGQGLDTRPHNIWVPADASAPELISTYAAWAAREGTAVYVIPGTGRGSTAPSCYADTSRMAAACVTSAAIWVISFSMPSNATMPRSRCTNSTVTS